MQDTDNSEIQRLKKEIENLRAELSSISSAADRNSVQLGKVTRQNREYYELIEKLKADQKVKDQKKHETRQITTKRVKELEADHNEKLINQKKQFDHEIQRQLEDQKKEFQNEIRKTKKKNWCAVCAKEGMFLSGVLFRDFRKDFGYSKIRENL